jgi:hypothetical protein
VRIVILSHKDVSGWYAATLMERGHEVTIDGPGAIDVAVKLYSGSDFDGCLLLSDDPDSLVIADHMKASGKKVWRELADIPAAQPTDAKRTEKARPEKKRIKCVGVGLAPAGRWWVVLEWETAEAGYHGYAEVESTHDAYDDAVKWATELAAEHKVRWVERW